MPTEPVFMTHLLRSTRLRVAGLVIFCMSELVMMVRNLLRGWFLPTKITCLDSSMKLLTTLKASISLMQPGGPDSSKMKPCFTPPPSKVSSCGNFVEYIAFSTMNAADCVNGAVLRVCNCVAENKAWVDGNGKSRST